MPTVSLPEFPDKDDFAQQFFKEALRHLTDAQILHQASRSPSSITSSMKAAELGLKTVCILDGAMGWWDDLLKTHSPWSLMQKHEILKRHTEALKSHLPTLPAGMVDLEIITPNRPGIKNFQVDQEANPEYPFVSYSPTASGGPPAARAHSPSDYFTAADSLRHYNIARDLLESIQAVYPSIAAWGFPLPPSL